MELSKTIFFSINDIADGPYNLLKVCFCRYTLCLWSQSLSITEAAITGSDKSEHTQSTCPQYALSLFLQCFFIIHMIACVSNLGGKRSAIVFSIFIIIMLSPFQALYFYQSFLIILLTFT